VGRLLHWEMVKVKKPAMLRMRRKLTRHPQPGSCRDTRGNRAGTTTASAAYSQQARKMGRLQVYAGKRVENRRLRGKCAVRGCQASNLGLLRR
jgi:hypothetical protein